jgi:hypothetical protein
MSITIELLMPFKNMKVGQVVCMTDSHARSLIAKGYATEVTAFVGDLETKESKRKEPVND